ncbi:MAG TPA: hypothetical protein VN653_17960 [Anaerolineales bacterium]|jgi:hypothetical protein|nr:hypothetical protein [Anaerolineales bacterium]
MKIDEIKLLYDYNDWADARILAACTRVSPEQYAAPTSYGRRGLRATMVHILDNIWQQRGSRSRDFTGILWQTRRHMMRPSFTKTPFRHSRRCEAAALLTCYGPEPSDFGFTLALNERAEGKS